ncbi:TPA: hypothetical protein N0F65_001637 [Lagenidium giganteum]|uniref:Peptidase C1A papain C-terminal domain-containing protein n=1 Tax=Lagenidium giganteum TaxID=4803 RepID=A0AAV2YG52_9STRA|nr:TPA: hypothetical protein N0F65_001637 [Lagenidium giganteum]
MKLAIIASFAALATAVSAASVQLDAHHHQRFLQQQPELQAELAAWKQSDAGRYAKDNGLYVENNHESSNDDELKRFYLTKVGIEQSQKNNPGAVFSVNTPFTLMTNEEFAEFVGKSYQRGRPSSRMLRADDDVAVNVSERSLQEQDSVDWTTTGCVAPPKDQGHCGSCWAFASIGALESAYCLTHNNRLQQFSEQQVNSCATQAGGCNGGFPSIGLEYVRDNGGVCTETGYPYTSGKTQQTGKCNARSCKKTPLQISVQRVDASEDGFVSAIASQPIAVGVTAGNAEWKQYSGGVLSACSTTQLDHAVLAVGYGTDVNDNSPYFKIKNSWGSQWGEDGFIRLQRAGDDSACGIINTDAVFPTF